MIYTSNASKLHRTVGDALSSSPYFRALRIRQEVPVSSLNPDYPTGRHRFDFVVYGLNIVIECHGKQHYEVATFGQDMETAIQAFKDQKERDAAKKEAALEAGYVYLEVPYNQVKKVDGDFLWALYLENKNELYETKDIKVEKNPFKEKHKKVQAEKRSAYLKSEVHKERLKKAREYRREQYLRLKKERENV